MTERFDTSPIRLRPKPLGVVSIESGGEVVSVDKPAAGKPDEGRPTRPPIPPGWDVRMLQGNETLSTVRGGEEDLDHWVGKHGDADKLEVRVGTRALSTDDLAPLVEVANRHQIDIDVLLSDDG